MPFPSKLVPLFKKEYPCKTFHMKMNLHETFRCNTFSYEDPMNGFARRHPFEAKRQLGNGLLVTNEFCCCLLLFSIARWIPSCSPQQYGCKAPLYVWRGGALSELLWGGADTWRVLHSRTRDRRSSRWRLWWRWNGRHLFHRVSRKECPVQKQRWDLDPVPVLNILKIVITLNFDSIEPIGNS